VGKNIWKTKSKKVETNRLKRWLKTYFERGFFPLSFQNNLKGEVNEYEMVINGSLD